MPNKRTPPKKKLNKTKKKGVTPFFCFIQNIIVDLQNENNNTNFIYTRVRFLC
jgi:hypothetical protein